MTPDTERDLRSAMELRRVLHRIVRAWRADVLAADLAMYRVEKALRDDAGRATEREDWSDGTAQQVP